MYIRYRAIHPSYGKEILEIAEMVGITRNPKTGFIVLTLAENYMDVYFKLDKEQYEKMVNEICENLTNGINVYTIKPVGIMNNTDYFKYTESKTEAMNKIFKEIKFKNS